MKNVLLINAALTILFLSETYAGSTHDKRIADATPYPLPAGSRLLQDLGFLAFTLDHVEIITDLPPIIFGDGMKKQEVISIPDRKCRHVKRQILFQSKRELWHYYMHVYRDGSQSQFSTRHSLA